MQTEYEKIVIRPLTLRGVFGITKEVYSRRAFAMFVFTLLFLAFSIAVFVPGYMPIARLIEEFGDKLTDSFANVEGGIKAVLRIALDGISGVMLVLLGWGVFTLVLTPMQNGTMYDEMASRVYGTARSTGALFARNKFSLRSCFTTSLCVMLYCVAAFIVINIASWALVGASLTSFLISGLRAFAFSTVPVIALTLGTAGVAALTVGALIGFMYISFVYPIAVSEKKKGFKAIGRSMKLVGTRFKRVFAANIVLLLFTLAALGAAVGVCFLLEYAVPGFGPYFYSLLIALVCLVTLIFIPYKAAMDTVLYYDAIACETEQEPEYQPQNRPILTLDAADGHTDVNNGDAESSDAAGDAADDDDTDDGNNKDGEGEQ